MDKDKRLMEASWWERLKGKLGFVLMGRAMLSKFLIQFYWGCVPSLLLDLRPNYGGGISELWGTLKLLQSNLLDEKTKAQRDEKIYSVSHSWLLVCVLQFSSVTQSCPTLCNSMNHSMPGLLVHHWLPEFTQTYVHWFGDAIQPSHPLSSPSPPAFNLSPTDLGSSSVSVLSFCLFILFMGFSRQEY